MNRRAYAPLKMLVQAYILTIHSPGELDFVTVAAFEDEIPTEVTRTKRLVESVEVDFWVLTRRNERLTDPGEWEHKAHYRWC